MIVACTHGHLPALALIHAASFPADEQWTEAAIAPLLEQVTVFGLVAEAGGFVLARVAADESEILTLAVMPPMRGQGLGRRLLDAAQGEAARRGAASMFLEVADDNRAARALYRAAAYVEVGRRRSYYPNGSDALILRRSLQALPSRPVA